MSTEALVRFKDPQATRRVWLHGDAYPEGQRGVIAKLHRARAMAWELPRFEAEEFGAAFVAAARDEYPGGVYLRDGDSPGPQSTPYTYDVTCDGHDIRVQVLRFGTLEAEGTLAEMAERYPT